MRRDAPVDRLRPQKDPQQPENTDLLNQLRKGLGTDQFDDAKSPLDTPIAGLGSALSEIAGGAGQDAARRTPNSYSPITSDRFDHDLATGTGFTASHLQGGAGGPDASSTAELKVGDVSANARGSLDADVARARLVAAYNADSFEPAARAQAQVASRPAIDPAAIAPAGQISQGADAKASITVDPLRANASATIGREVFAGARAGVEVSQKIRLLDPARADYLAKLDVDAGLKNARLSSDFDIGASLGVRRPDPLESPGMEAIRRRPEDLLDAVREEIKKLEYAGRPREELEQDPVLKRLRQA